MVITRFAPSPTGDLHIGGVRTALYSWLHARQHNGAFRLRIEDTDRQRSNEASTQVILEGMRWLGLTHQGEILYQGARVDRYNRVIDEMLEKGLAYHCWCTAQELDAMRAAQMVRGEKPRYNGKYRNGGDPVPGVTPVVRFKNPLTGEVAWNDRVRGHMVIKNSELDDIVIRRSDGTPTYNFSVVVDDAAQGVTLVVRGEDHISNTPRQINIYRALDYAVPEFAHVPMILGDDGKRLSKRHGATNILDYRKAGYLPEAVLNYLVRLGWAHGDQELFSMEELLRFFRIDDVHGAPSIFNAEKLRWLNQQYLHRVPVERIVALLPEHLAAAGFAIASEVLEKAVPYYLDRAKTLAEMAGHMRWLANDPDAYPAKSAKRAFKGKNTRAILDDLGRRVEALGDYTRESVQGALEETVAHFALTFAAVGQPARLALTGGLPSPELAACFVLIDRQAALRRLRRAVKFLSENQ